MPASVRDILRERAALADSFFDYARQNFFALRHPVIATGIFLAAIIAILVLVLTADARLAAEATQIFGFSAVLFFAGAWIGTRQRINADYQATKAQRLAASSDLRAGRARELRLELTAPPVILLYPQGCLVIAPISDERSMFFAISDGRRDGRARAVLNGDFSRRYWRWLRLAGSGQVVEFEAMGDALGVNKTHSLSSSDSVTEIATALGNPRDSDIVAMPMDEIERVIARLL